MGQNLSSILSFTFADTTRHYFIVIVILKSTFLVLGLFKGCNGISRTDVVPVVFAVDCRSADVAMSGSCYHIGIIVDTQLVIISIRVI